MFFLNFDVQKAAGFSDEFEEVSKERKTTNRRRRLLTRCFVFWSFSGVGGAGARANAVRAERSAARRRCRPHVSRRRVRRCRRMGRRRQGAECGCASCDDVEIVENFDDIEIVEILM